MSLAIAASTALSASSHDCKTSAMSVLLRLRTTFRTWSTYMKWCKLKLRWLILIWVPSPLRLLHKKYSNIKPLEALVQFNHPVNPLWCNGNNATHYLQLFIRRPGLFYLTKWFSLQNTWLLNYLSIFTTRAPYLSPGHVPYPLDRC